MPYFDIYSRRNIKPCDGLVYEISKEDRVQITYVITDFFSRNPIFDDIAEDTLWKAMNDRICRIHKKPYIGIETFFGRSSFSTKVTQQFQIEQNPDHVIDIIEVCFRVLSKAYTVFGDQGRQRLPYPPEGAIEDLNTVFLENCIGLKFADGYIIRSDSEVLYQQITKPAMAFLTKAGFEYANEEYMAAQEQFRHGNYKETVMNIGKAFESTLKVICHKKGYVHDTSKGVKHLVDVLYNNNFLPESVKANLGIVRALLEGSLTFVRNKSAHGAGVNHVEMNAGIASLALNMGGSLIKFCVDASENGSI
jgi:hypothetical protein